MLLPRFFVLRLDDSSVLRVQWLPNQVLEDDREGSANAKGMGPEERPVISRLGLAARWVAANLAMDMSSLLTAFALVAPLPLLLTGTMQTTASAIPFAHASGEYFWIRHSLSRDIRLRRPRSEEISCMAAAS